MGKRVRWGWWVPGVVAAGLSLGTAEPAAAQELGPTADRVVGPADGYVARRGQDRQNGVKLAADEWNGKGGVLGRKVVVADPDDACAPSRPGR